MMSKGDKYKKLDFVADFLELIEKRWVGVEQVWLFSEKLSIQSIEQRIAFFRELKQVIRLIPQEVFVNLQQRQNLLQAVAEAQERAIDEEEDSINGLA